MKHLRLLSCLVVLVGKKNLEVRPIAINKGEIVKRILYLNPDAQFVFCAGDDKVRLSRTIFRPHVFRVGLTDECFSATRQTDEDMFRALHLSETAFPYTMEAPLSVSLVSTETTREHLPVELQLTAEDIFTTAVGHPSKRTLAKWHVTSPHEVVTELLKLAGVRADEAKL